MTEKEMMIQTWDSEFKTTLRVLKAYPADKLDMRPAEKSRTARELAWVICSDEFFLVSVMAGKIDFSQSSPPAPHTLEEITAMYEKAHKENLRKAKKLTPAQMRKKVKFPVGPGKLKDFAAKDIFWLTIFDNIHHRGQFSVYIRIAGGKLPSIYGPTADEPWM